MSNLKNTKLFKEDQEEFKIPQMPDDSIGLRTSKPQFEKTEALSPMAGYYVKEVQRIPENENHEDIDLAYDTFRVNPKLTSEDEVKRYGQNYHEFRSIDSHIDADSFVYDKKEAKNHHQDGFGLDLGVIIDEDEFLNQDEQEKPSYTFEETKVINTPTVPFVEEIKDPQEVRISNEFEETNTEVLKPSIPDFIGFKNTPVEEKEEENNSLPKTIIYKAPEREINDEIVDASYSYETPVFSGVGGDNKIPPFVRDLPNFETQGQLFEAPVIESLDKPSAYEELRNKQQENSEEVIHKDIYANYVCPGLDLLNPISQISQEVPEWVTDKIEVINTTLSEFGVDGTVVDYTYGPAVTRYEIKLAPGVPVRKFTQIEDNLKMNLSAKTIRIEAPIPGKSNVGVEVPNNRLRSVAFKEIMGSPEMQETKDPLKVGLGLNIDGKPVCVNIASMPHGLVGGTTGSGKSVCINTILVSILMHNSPDDVKFILIDPKQVELVNYQDLPHLATPVINDVQLASEALKWATTEMDRRYRLFSSVRTKGLEGYNERIKNDPNAKKLQYILIVIDELADLMITCGNDVEDSIQRITQMGRSAGIHLIVATQRPTTDVVKGTIKNNIPARIAFRVSSFVDSSTILDQAGAENLLGKGDMLLKLIDAPERVQGAFISDDEIMRICDFIRERYKPDYLFTHEELQDHRKEFYGANGEDQELIYGVATSVIERGTCSINNIQSSFSVGFKRASNIVSILEDMGIVSEGKGTTGREVLMTQAQVDELFKKGN